MGISIKAIIETPYGILVVKDAVKNNFKYTLPGGGMERGESYEDTIKRELKEEFRLDENKMKVSSTTLPKNGPIIGQNPNYQRYIKFVRIEEPINWFLKSEIVNIAFLAGISANGNNRLENIQVDTDYVIKNYLKPDRIAERQKRISNYFSFIDIDQNLMTRPWQKVCYFDRTKNRLCARPEFKAYPQISKVYYNLPISF